MKVALKIIRIKQYLFRNELMTKIIKNSSWLVADRLFTLFIGAIVTALLARYFGPEKYGVYNYALAFTALFTSISTLGLEIFIVKSIVSEEDNEASVLCTSLFLRLFGGIVLTVLSYCLIRVLEPGEIDLHILVFIMSITMVVKSTEVFEYWMQAHQMMKMSSVIRMSTYIVSSLLKLGIIIFKGNLFYYAIVYMIDAVIIGTSLVIAYYIFKNEKFSFSFNICYAKKILSQSWYLILSGLMITLYMKIDQIMLGSMIENKSGLGVYSAAVLIAEMWYFIPNAIITSFRPVIMSKKKNNEQEYLKLIQLLYTIIAWIGIGFGILIVIFSNLIIKIIFGNDYLDAANILSVNVWAGTFAMLGVARSTWLISEGLQRYTLFYTIVGLVVNVSLNYILIPMEGALGSAFATLVAQFCVNIISLSFFKETRISTIMILRAFSIKSLIQCIKK